MVSFSNRVLNHNDRQIQLLCDSNDLQSLNEIAKSHGKYVHVNKNEPVCIPIKLY